MNQSSALSRHHNDDAGVLAAVERIAAVSTIPAMLKRVLEAVEDEKTTIYDMVGIIEHDPALASRVIGIANTAFYAYRRKIRNVHNAVFLLGFNMVRNLAVSVSVFGDGSSASGQLKALWRHSFEVAAASSMIAERTGLAKKEDAFLAGLINDIGRVLLHQTFGPEYAVLAEGGSAGLLEREREAFGANHSDVGAHFAWKYNFPEECVMAVRFHHAPEAAERLPKGKNTQVIPIAYVADAVISAGMTGTEYDLTLSPDHKRISDSIYLDEDGAREIREKAEAIREAVAGYYA